MVVRRAKSRGEMRPPAPKVEKAPERVPWGEAALKQETAHQDEECGN